MIRLSRKAWNNVLIFSMLLMILLFNTSYNILNRAPDSPQHITLLPENSQLVRLQLDDVKLERIGTGWRATSDFNVDSNRIEELVNTWQTAKMSVSNEDLPASSPQIVIAWLASENSGRVFQLYANGGNTVVLYQQQIYTIDDIPLEQLVLQGKG